MNKIVNKYLLRRSPIERGQTLLEGLVALGIAVTVITGITLAISSSLQNVEFSKNQKLASNYAQEALEIARQLRNNDYTTFAGLDGTAPYCLSKNSTTFVRPCSLGANVDTFFRRVTFTPNNCQAGGDGPTGVKAEVLWTSSKCTGGTFCHKTQLNTCLSDVN